MSMSLSPAAADLAGARAYHAVRFPYDPRRAAVWRTVCKYLQPWVDEAAPMGASPCGSYINSTCLLGTHCVALCALRG